MRKFLRCIWWGNIFLLALALGLFSASFFSGMSCGFITIKGGTFVNDVIAYSENDFSLKISFGGMQLAERCRPRETVGDESLPSNLQVYWRKTQPDYPYEINSRRMATLASRFTQSSGWGFQRYEYWLLYFPTLPEKNVLSTRAITFPLVTLLVPWVFLTHLSVRKKRRLARYKRLGLCSYCGYDLQGLCIRCPECGKKPAS